MCFFQEPALIRFDETSNLWPEPFSTLINCIFPLEYVYSDWFQWQANIEAQRRDPESPGSLTGDCFEAGSRVEGFCIPQFLLRNSEIDQVNARALDIKEQWLPDLDLMKVVDSFVETNEKSRIPIFTVEHLEDDPKYVKLRLTDEFKEHDSRFKNAPYLHHSYLLPDADHPMVGRAWTHVNGEKGVWSNDVHGPVRKLMKAGFPCHEEDRTDVFKFPIAWPEPAMEWLVRSRPCGWPSSELVQEVFDSGCLLAPVGRGKRLYEPIDTFEYYRNPEQPATNSAMADAEGKWAMEETEWRISFSLAENKLGRSVSPVQRHVMVLLKMIKKAYFPDVISTYYLKNLLFWECESKGEAFWKEDNFAKCLLSMLDRLHECLETSDLPYYFMPQSNLLQYEDTANLKEAAIVVAEVRREILPKTVSLLKRLQSLTFQSNTYLRDVGVPLKDHLLKMQDRHLSEDDHGKLLTALLSLFVGKCKDVIKSLRRTTLEPDKGKEVENLLNVALYAYQSILARNLYKLWFLMTKDEDTKDGEKEEDEFTSFVREEVKGLSLDGDFVAQSLAFFHSAKNGMEPSRSILCSRAMKYLREEHVRMAVESTESSLGELKAKFSWFKVSVLKEAAERATKKLLGESHTRDTLSKEAIQSALEEEIQALHGERIGKK